ncbi:MAG: prepilin-type N-terminal cleavage/methylation domain-containing protein [Armatimonadota bacterium]
MIKKKRNRSGLTLIEVLISSMLLIVCMVGILDSFVYGSQIKQKSENATMALFIAQSVLESTLEYSGLFSNPDEEQGEVEEDEFILEEPYKDYKCKIIKKVMEPLRLKQVTVRVSTPGGKLGHTVELTALATGADR